MFPVRIPGGVLPGAVRAQQQQAKDESEKQKCQVRLEVKPFTRMSVNKQETRSQMVKEYGFQPKRKASVEDGSVLPNKFEPFPRSLYGKPLEEIDNFIYDETFCVVSKRFRKNYIHRFTSTSSFYLFSPWNPVRKSCIFLCTNQYFDYTVMTTILLNCIFLAKTEPVEEAEYIFLAIYTAEMFIKCVAKGFMFNKYTYLRNPWNWLDFVVITSGYATIGLEVGNLAGLRTFRVLRALKTVSIMPGLKTIINALLHSFKQLAEVMTLTIFCLMVFALFALQVYMGELRNKCVPDPPKHISHLRWKTWISNETLWLINDDGDPLICGNVTGSRHCPQGYICLRVGENPNHGYTSFDNFLWSMLTTFQLITLDYWENVYNMVIASCGPFSVIFFTVVVFFGSFYLINLMLAVVALSYEEEAEITQEERRKDLTDHRDDSTFSFDPSKISVKQLDKCNKRRIDSRKGVLLSSYSRKKTRRRKRRGGVSGPEGGDRSVSPSPKRLCTAPPTSPPVDKKTEGTVRSTPTTLHPSPYSRRELQMSREGSSNTSEGGSRGRPEAQRESSLEDSGVVDDHEEGDIVSVDVVQSSSSVQNLDKNLPSGLNIEVKEKETEQPTGIKCNGVNGKKTENISVYTLPQERTQIVTIDDLQDRNCDGCVDCCINYHGWLRIQNSLYRIVRDPLFELLITLCILLNTLFLAMEHHGMSQNVKSALDIGNKVFTSIFTLECTMKLLALSKEFFNCGWNIFDLIIVSVSLLDLSFELVDGLSVLRCLRLLRVLKLAQSWTTMKVLLSIIISTLGALGNLTFVLVIIIYIFAVIGMQLFSRDYTPERFDPDPVPRWNFSDFFHSFMMIFRILCGEWIEPLWDCMRAEKHEGAGTCFAIFLPALVMGNFMVLNLFLALLLNSFNSEELKSKKEEVGEHSKIARSFERIRSIIRKHKKKEPNDSEPNLKLEELVKEMIKEQKSNPSCNVDLSPNKQLEQSPSKICFEDETLNVSKETTLVSNENVEYGIQEYAKENVKEVDKENEKSDKENIDHDPFHIIVESESGTLLKHDAFINGGDKLGSPTESNNTYEILQVQNLPKTKKDECPFEPRVSLGEWEDALYARIMKEALSFAPSLTAPVLLPPVDESPTEPVRKDSPFVSNLIHRRSYALATRKESFEASEESKPATSISTVEASRSAKVNSWLTLVSYVDELTVGGKRDAEGKYIDDLATFPGFGKKKQVKQPYDCFPPHCYQRINYCDDCIATPFGQWWMDIRTKVLSFVDTPAFEWIVLVLIFASSITLCFEDIYLDENKFLKSILYWTNLGFCVLFSVEMALKWVALGFYKYFSSFWTILDFTIVFVSVFSLLIEENENLKVLRSLRTLRALRPLRAISRWQGMRIVVNALMYAIPSIFNVLLVCLVFWLIFSIMGVQFFGGKFYKCVDEDGERLPSSIIKNKNECLHSNYTWRNSKITFDNVGNGYLALFQVATFEGWMEVMADAVDATGVDEQPQYEANLYAYFYFVIFIVCGSFFTLNLFIGVIIDNFNMLKKKYEGGVLEMFLTESQKHYYTAMKKLGRKKPQKVIKRPINQFLAMFYDLSNSRRFEVAIFALIFLNMLTMGIEHYNQHHAVFFVLEVSNAFFTTVFGLEAIVKIIGLRYHYFTVPWNLFDFVLVLASILGILMEDIMIDFPISPTLLRVVRVFRIGRILRLIKAAKGIRKLLFALVVSLPALFNIGALLALITFIYAIIGMSLFGHVKHQRALDDMVNFETFGRSMQLLFRLMTSAGWNDVLESLMVQPPDCDLYFNNQPNGNCGHPLLAITYFTSFIIISYMIVINMYIAIILENFNQAHQEEEIGIVEDDLEMFYIRWSKFDPHATQFIRFSQLSEFIASLDPPLGIPKPNTVALVSFNLPIARGNKIHCLDILHALVKHVLGHVEETEEFKKLQDQMDIKFKKQFPTRKELEIVSSTRMWKRQDRAARIIQRAYRNYRLEKKNASLQDGEDGTTQTSSPGGWQGRLSAFLHVHRGSRASSRKSSRASDASDISDLGTTWLNLPLLLLSGTQPNGNEETMSRNDLGAVSNECPSEIPKLQCSLDLPENGVCITVTEPSPDSGQPLAAQNRRAAFRRSSELPRVVQALVHRESEEYDVDS
ncbi:sodium channel protein 60E [Halyomorpha halys]|uniref:sodium channel protein 60E n=1 Tax=Halyomorpha halys TaxID=286706 RepID=UPI0006D4FB6A